MVEISVRANAEGFATAVVAYVVKIAVTMLAHRNGANVAGVILIGVNAGVVNVRAAFIALSVHYCVVAACIRDHTAAVVAKVILIISVSVIAEGYATTGVTNVILIRVSVRKGRACCKGVLIILADGAANAGLVINRRAITGSRGLKSLVVSVGECVRVRQLCAFSRLTVLTGFGIGAGCGNPAVTELINFSSLGFAAF